MSYKLTHTSYYLLLGLLLAMGFMLPGRAMAQDEMDDYGPKPTKTGEVKARHEKHLEKYKDNADVLVRPGLVANRKTRTVEVWMEATGLAPGELVEFLLVDQRSSHGYEAILWSFGKPSDVHAALEFIGLKPGTPFNPAAMRFWSDGDRVRLHVQEAEEGKGPSLPVEEIPIEELILDNETEEPLPADGFVFAGSIKVPPPDGQGPMRYAADEYDPRSVASIYNEPASVLDVPRQVSQGEAYGRMVVNPDYAMEHGTLLKVVMTPGDPEGKFRPRQMKLAMEYAPEKNGLVFRLMEQGEELVKATGMKPVLEKLVASKRGDTPPSLELALGEALSIEQAGQVAKVMAMAEAMGVARIKPPEKGQLYYRAFVPDPRWRTTEKRPTQPWELHLKREKDKLAGEMVWNEPIWSQGSTEPAYKRHAHVVEEPAAVRTRLDADTAAREEAGKRPLPTVLLVFAAPDLTYREVLQFVRPALKTHNTVHIYLEEKSVEHGE